MLSIFKRTKTLTFNKYVNYVSNHLPQACAEIKGGKDYPLISGKVSFFDTSDGVLVLSEINNLPPNETGGFFAMHIHSGDSCRLDENGNYPESVHYNPQNYYHPSHAGDLPVILSNNGESFSLVLTKRFKVNQIIGLTVLIHKDADDFRTQPSGNSGTKIACGVITKS